MSALMEQHERRAGARARLGMPMSIPGRVRLDLIGKAKPNPIVIPPPIAPVVNYAPFNFLRQPSPLAIIHLVALKHRLKVDDIRGRDQGRAATAARREAVRLVKSHCDMSALKLGRLFHRDHSTILNLLGRVSPARARAKAMPGGNNGEH